MKERINERHSKILNLVSCHGRMTVTKLSKLLDISEVTLRKDLTSLVERGLIRRDHGFASAVDSDDVSNRLSFNYNIKQAIAKDAARAIKDGETIMIESGSCCALLAESIVMTHRDITIVTNSVFIASFIRQKATARLILLGGEFQKESQVMVGPLVKKCVEDFYVNKFFIGTDGFNDVGAMSGDLMRAEAVRDMASSAQRVIILTESKKFSQIGVVSLLPYDSIDTIYTDDLIDSSIRARLNKVGIKVSTSHVGTDISLDTSQL